MAEADNLTNTATCRMEKQPSVRSGSYRKSTAMKKRDLLRFCLDRSNEFQLAIDYSNFLVQASIEVSLQLNLLFSAVAARVFSNLKLAKREKQLKTCAWKLRYLRRQIEAGIETATEQWQPIKWKRKQSLICVSWKRRMATLQKMWEDCVLSVRSDDNFTIMFAQLKTTKLINYRLWWFEIFLCKHRNSFCMTWKRSECMEVASKIVFYILMLRRLV